MSLPQVMEIVAKMVRVGLELIWTEVKRLTSTTSPMDKWPLRHLAATEEEEEVKARKIPMLGLSVETGSLRVRKSVMMVIKTTVSQHGVHLMSCDCKNHALTRHNWFPFVDDDCTNQCTRAVCGDGIVGPGEQCDDGNDIDE